MELQAWRNKSSASQERIFTKNFQLEKYAEVMQMELYAEK